MHSRYETSIGNNDPTPLNTEVGLDEWGDPFTSSVAPGTPSGGFMEIAEHEQILADLYAQHVLELRRASRRATGATVAACAVAVAMFSFGPSLVSYVLKPDAPATSTPNPGNMTPAPATPSSSPTTLSTETPSLPTTAESSQPSGENSSPTSMPEGKDTGPDSTPSKTPNTTDDKSTTLDTNTLPTANEEQRQSKAKAGFATVKDADFMWPTATGGTPVKFAAFNANQIGGVGGEWGDTFSEAELNKIFAAFPKKSAVRVSAWPDSDIAQMQLATKVAGKYDQKVIFTLAEGQQWDEIKADSDEFFKEGYKKSILPWIKKVVPLFEKDTNIFAWEVMNESGGIGGDVKPETMFSFHADIFKTIRDIDKNHLVSTGRHHCFNGSGWGEENCERINKLADFGSAHDYSEREIDSKDGSYIDEKVVNTVKTIKRLGKPVYVGEVAIRGGDKGDCVRSGKERNEFAVKKLDKYFKELGVNAVAFWRVIKDTAPCKGAGDEQIDVGPDDSLVATVAKYNEKLNTN